VIDRYLAESNKAVLGTKAQVLKTIKNSDLGDLKCSEITSRKLVASAKDLSRNVEPQTCGNYFFRFYPAYSPSRGRRGAIPLVRHEFEDSVTVLKKLGLIRKNSERDRRPTLEELDKLMALSRPSVRDGAFSPARPARHY
jgi:hypothetical protein